MSQEHEHVKCLIIGSGPAGYTAAIYASRADLKPVMYTGIVPGGQLTQTTDVENYPGYPDGVMGPEMMEDFRKQAHRLGTDIRFGYVTSVDFSRLPHRVVVDEDKTILSFLRSCGLNLPYDPIAIFPFFVFLSPFPMLVY